MDYLVVGAGPAGLQLGYFLKKARRSYEIIEAGPAPGTFFRTFPRHRKLISINKPHTGTNDPELNLRMDWNSLLSDDPELLFTRYSDRYFPDADDLVRYLGDFAAKTNLNVRYNTRATRISRNGHFEVLDQRGETHTARRLIVSTGPSKPFLPNIPGIEGVERYHTVSTDPKDFTDQRVLIIGKGNSAFETADNLVETAAVIHVVGRSSIRMAWKSHYVGHLRAVNNNFLDTYQLKSQNAVLDGNVLKIVKDEEGYLVTVSFSRADEVTKDIRYDRVIACTGFRFNADHFAEDCRPNLVIDDRFPELTPEWESANIPDLYFAGTLMQVRDFKKSTSGFIHGFRYCVRAQQRIFERKYHGADWPSTRLPNRPESISNAIIRRVNRSSALWQQFGQLGDLVVTNCDHARYYEEMPVGYMPPTGFVVTLEYGPDHDKVDPFDITVRRPAQNAPEQALDAAYLHPVIRHYRGGELAGTHHVAENLENDWTSRDAHRVPLERFLARQLAVPSIA
ncbi:pyridine nucleotide-disulfide oxidoreductase [Lentzea tibetensis]|uniref:Pyridine nucleotide-disulfide oxidoreductase n=1 Tax=Lentzea tibetensis TaxID=2591470 RepID=A0A563F052_9PSEU|nr:pyridine nucleotide-disulfide oxidoreductase [Lentzea tibetensis]